MFEIKENPDSRNLGTWDCLHYELNQSGIQSPLPDRPLPVPGPQAGQWEQCPGCLSCQHPTWPNNALGRRKEEGGRLNKLQPSWRIPRHRGGINLNKEEKQRLREAYEQKKENAPSGVETPLCRLPGSPTTPRCLPRWPVLNQPGIRSWGID